MNFLQDVKNVLQVHDLESGKFLYKVPLAIGSIDGVHGRKKSNELFFKFSSMVNPGVIYFLDMSQESPVPQVSRVFSFLQDTLLLCVIIQTQLSGF